MTRQDYPTTLSADAGEYELALRLAITSPTDPNTLIRAAEDFKDDRPMFALGHNDGRQRWRQIVRGSQE